MTESVETEELKNHEPDASAERLRVAAREVDSWQVVHRPKGGKSFAVRLEAARHGLRQVEASIARAEHSAVGNQVAPTDEQSAPLKINANRRLLHTTLSSVAGGLQKFDRLPRIASSQKGAEEIRVVRIAELYIRIFDGVYSEETLIPWINELQKREPLNVDELWSLAAFLRFILLEKVLEEALRESTLSAADAASRILARLENLRALANADWISAVEPLIVFDGVLKQDPANVYSAMDFDSRERYRKRIAQLSRYSDCSESEVARAALKLAMEGAAPKDEERVRAKKSHVGYYLIDQGKGRLESQIDYYPPMMDRWRNWILANNEDFFLTGIELFTVLIIAVVLFPVLPHSRGFEGLITAFILLAIPATQCAVDILNTAVTSLFDAEPLPKLDFSAGVPAACATLIAVPSLLLNEEQVRDLVTGLEVRFLANRDPNLHFALLSDLPDSVSEPKELDSNPLVELAQQLIGDLNKKYASAHGGSLLLLHRHRVFNQRQGVWMGWERKRGKLLDLNKLLAGEFDAFPIKAGDADVLRHVRYVLTLDSDTQLPRGTAARLVGTIAHPLNAAVIDPKLRIVKEGYGILQPRIGIAVESASRSRLASIYSGQTGFDVYARAVSDTYQDLFQEGIFTGKGIYEPAVLHAVLDRRFPRNALLSHDLIEGAYARAGQASDVELIDDYPSHYMAYSRRKHRWVRGDWQITQWMFSRVPDESGNLGANPISRISRWKIFDNLRRSLVDPFLLILFVCGWMGLPGGPLYWTLMLLFAVLFSSMAQLLFSLVRAALSDQKQAVDRVFIGFGQGVVVALMNLIFLPHQMMLAVDAIVRSLIRRFVTGQRLLEWETAAQAESKSSRRTPVDRYLLLSPLVALALALLVYFFAPQKNAIYIAAPILALWAVANPVALWLNKQPKDESRHLIEADRAYLTMHAARIWGYFKRFSSDRHNFLIPDNVEEKGLFEAARVSPTNVGLLLNTRQVACELGFLTAPEFADLTRRTLVTIRELAKYRGHIYNWFSTETLKPLDAAPFVSSVDSGNFAASLYTLRSGALELLRKPLLNETHFSGLRVFSGLAQAQERRTTSLTTPSMPGSTALKSEWLEWVSAAEVAQAGTSDRARNEVADHWWLGEFARRIGAIRAVLQEYMPWQSPKFAPLCKGFEQTIPALNADLSIESATKCVEDVDALLTRSWTRFSDSRELLPLAEELRTGLAIARKNLKELASALRGIADEAETVAESMDFEFLVHPGRKLLSIGYGMGKPKVENACYDMLASESRMATFLAIARGDLAQERWFKLARDYVQAFGHVLLMSWSGTMFEYLMPSIWMHRYPNTLLAQTQQACVVVQRDFARAHRIPWGISESGTPETDDAGHYHYHAFGIPQISLWSEAKAGPVVSPYSTFLAVGLDAREALHNLRRMELDGWVGDFGFYESAGFTHGSRKPELTREWMAHHQGMALLAVTNLLHENVVRKWFHANPIVMSAELLLHEMALSEGMIRARLDEFAVS
ncbi:MAG TPA: glucoamylase family protein [Terracidiphilus sp.]|jgi:cyclic beta-1,2-glucan synthetase|nr:glucoamylase family protein [Terracidiphilus sp.]